MLGGYGRPGSTQEYADYKEIKEEIRSLRGQMDEHDQKTERDHRIHRVKENNIASNIEKLHDELTRLAYKTIDENKLQTHFAELQSLLTQLSQQPEIQHDHPELAKQIAELNKEPALANAQLFVYLVPEIIQKCVPMMPNIKLECDLGRMLEKFSDLLKKIVS